MLNKENIIRQFLDSTSLEVKYLGDVGFIEMPSGMLAKVELAITNTRDHYTRLHVQILEKGKGKVDSLSFPFADLEEMYTSNEHGKNVTIHAYKVFNSRDIEWYILEPTKRAKAKLGQDIAEYIAIHSIGDF